MDVGAGIKIQRLQDRIAELEAENERLKSRPSAADRDCDAHQLEDYARWFETHAIATQGMGCSGDSAGNMLRQIADGLRCTPSAEPVAEVHVSGHQQRMCTLDSVRALPVGVHPLYTHPPQHESE